MEDEGPTSSRPHDDHPEDARLCATCQRLQEPVQQPSENALPYMKQESYSSHSTKISCQPLSSFRKRCWHWLKLTPTSNLQKHRSRRRCHNNNNSYPSYYYANNHSSIMPYSHLIVLVLIAIANSAGACSSRSTPKPRPPSQSTMRPNITFQTYACPPAYAAWYCLNGATCFTVKIADSILYNCECADGYMGQRCEFKDLDGSYLPTRERFLMGLGRPSYLGHAFWAVLTIVVLAALISAIYTRTRTRAKRQKIIRQQQADNNMSALSCVNEGSDSIPSNLASGGSLTGSYDLSVLGQSISYSLSQPPSAAYHIHFADGPRRCRQIGDTIISSRVPKTVKNFRPNSSATPHFPT